MDRYYFMPIIGTGTRQDPLRPKYIDSLPGLAYASMQMGNIPTTLVFLRGISQSQHNALVANADVVSPPENIDLTVTVGALASVKSELETLGIPAQFVQVGDTYRQTLRTIAGMFQFMQRAKGLGMPSLASLGANLDTRFNQLPGAVRNILIAAANSMNFDSSSLSGASTLRQIFKTMADQWGQRPLEMLGVLI